MKNLAKSGNSILTTNGLNMPDIFPTISYERIHKIVVLTQAKHLLYDHYAGAWNALAYRFKAAIDHGDAFISSVDTSGSAPPPDERYLQEKMLFDFFSTGFSAFESTFYGLYTIGAFVSPAIFPLSSSKDQQLVSPTRTRDLYNRAFPTDPILSTFNTLFKDVEYQKLRDTRNILTHRAAPGRRIYVSIGSGKAPMTEWKLNNEAFEPSLMANSKNDLSRLLFYLLENSAKFVKKHFKTS